jgi:hypothetical protein
MDDVQKVGNCITVPYKQYCSQQLDIPDYLDVKMFACIRVTFLKAADCGTRCLRKLTILMHQYCFLCYTQTVSFFHVS